MAALGCPMSQQPSQEGRASKAAGTSKGPATVEPPVLKPELPVTALQPRIPEAVPPSPSPEPPERLDVVDRYGRKPEVQQQHRTAERPVAGEERYQRAEVRPATPVAAAEPGVLPAADPARPLADRPPGVQRPSVGTSPAADRTATNSGLLPNPLRGGERPTALRPVQPSAPARPDRAESSPPVVEKGPHADRPPFDPVKENGPIFVDWPKPALALVITGQQIGYIEPCGCAGLDRMKGGMARRHTLFKTLRTQGWPIVGLDVGGIARGFGRQAELKFHTMVEGMRKMGYDAITFGATDLQLPAGELVSVAAAVEGQATPFLSANVGLFGFDAKMTAAYRTIEAGGRKLGITGILGKEYQKQIHNQEIELADPEAALPKIIPELKKRADYLILLAHASKSEAVALAERFPEFNLVVIAGGAAEPPKDFEMVKTTKTLLVEVGEKGMNAVVLGFFHDPQRPVRYQRVPLDSRFPASEDMRLLMAAYQGQVRELGLAGLSVRASPAPKRETGGQYVGSAKCESCHEASYKIWKKSGHARAYRTLVQLNPPRNFDPECISCHVVGWHPTKYFPYEGGYESVEKTPHLIDVGCESCHGPGELHAKAEMGSDKLLQEKYRKAVVVTKAESEKEQCYTCHDLDNSPDFKFETYWPKIEHKED